MAEFSPDAVCYLHPPRSATSLEQFAEHERAILHEMNRRVAAAASLPQLIDFLFDATAGLWPTDRLAVAFVEEDGKRIVSDHVRTNYEPVLLRYGYAEDLAGSSLQQVIEAGRPRIINDLAEYLKEHPQSRSTRLVVREGLRSSMTCPLVFDGKCVGVLFRSSRQVDAYQQHHIEMHQAIAERLSQAIEKAYRIQQLEQANRAYMEMLSFVSHELKSPIASMVTDGKVLLDGYLGDLQPKQREKLGRVVRKGEYLLELVREYLDLDRLESGRLTPNLRDDVDVIAEVLEPTIELIDNRLREKRMTLTRCLRSEPIVCQCDPELMRVVMMNLLENAIKYGRADGQIRVTVDPRHGTLRVVVWNEGQGFDPADRGKLFRKFSRLPASERGAARGTGVGLYTSWQIVQLHQGKIRARSQPGQWAEFYFWIPQPIPT